MRHRNRNEFQVPEHFALIHSTFSFSSFCNHRNQFNLWNKFNVNRCAYFTFDDFTNKRYRQIPFCFFPHTPIHAHKPRMLHTLCAEIDTYLSITFSRNVQNSQANRIFTNAKKKKNEGNANRVAKEKVETPTHEENIQPFYDTQKLTMNGGESNEEDFLTYNFVFVFFFYFAHRNTSTRVLFLSAKNETVRMTCVFVLVWYKFTGRLAKSRAEEDNRFLLLPQLVEDYIDRQFLSVRGQNTRTTTSSSSAGEMWTWTMISLLLAINGKNKNNRFEVMVRLDILLLRALTEQMKCHQNDTSFICCPVPSLFHPMNL